MGCDRRPCRVPELSQLALELLGAQGEPLCGLAPAREKLVGIPAGVGADALGVGPRVALDLLRPALSGLDDRLNTLRGGGRRCAAGLLGHGREGYRRGAATS